MANSFLTLSLLATTLRRTTGLKRPHLKVLEGEGQANGIKAQLLQAPHNGGKVLGEAVVALAQVARRCQPSVESIPTAVSGLQDGQAAA